MTVQGPKKKRSRASYRFTEEHVTTRQLGSMYVLTYKTSLSLEDIFRAYLYTRKFVYL